MLSSRAPSLQALLRQSPRLIDWDPRSRRVAQQTSWRAMSHCYKYPRPSVTVDVALVGQPEAGSTSSTKLLLIQRKNPPCQVLLGMSHSPVMYLPQPLANRVCTPGISL